jgi:hypothetical protein
MSLEGSKIFSPSAQFLLLLVFCIGISFEAASYVQSPLPRRCHSSQSSSKTRVQSALLASGDSSEITRGEVPEVSVECGPGFYKQTGPDGDYCVLDYDTIFVARPAEESANSIKQITQDEHYWDALESQNAARRKFGLPNLTPEQYVALQAENHLTGKQNIVDKTAEAFAQFDTNEDGVVCVRELREGLQKILRKTDHLSESRAQKVMEHFDDNGDGVLQPDEFMTVGQLRERLEAVIEAERVEMMATMTPAEQERRQQQQAQEGGVSLIGRFFNMFVDTCESNFDCNYPEVCCDLGFKKECCSSGQMARKMQLEYATVPVLQNI